MDAERLDIEKTLSALTVEEKLRMLSGDGMWHTFGAGALPRVRMSDGPNGLRMTDDGGSSAVPATCFPTPSMLANSFDPALLYNVGAAIGEEATALGVNLLLAPGLNIKRTPLGGRNFEYYSEDPYLSGTLGKAFVSGVQSTGVGACIKHFAANNTELYRMYSDSVIDDRALHELYLKPFEIALGAEPAAVMCAYNKLNGTYCSQNEYLLKTTLRDGWGYKGVTLSDWGAVRDRAKALAAGLDLEMPDSLGTFKENLRAAYEKGEITELDIDNALRRIIELIDNVYLEPYGDYDADAHDRLCYTAAVDSAVLLKNDNNFLPLTKNMKVTVVGKLAEHAPIQGGGSSHVTALKTLSPLDAFALRSIDVRYCRGYSADKKQNAALYDEALSAAVSSDAVVVFAGTPAPSEGTDRKSLSLPPEQDKLISALTNAGHRVIVVLVTPGPVFMPWINRVRSVLYLGLNGQAGALAAADILYGRVNPRGRLAETFPTADACGDYLCKDFDGTRLLYRESMFVGYRYYDAVERRTLFPFGHGLSFSEIRYDGMTVKRVDPVTFDVTVALTNLSVRDAYETVQIYVSDRTGRVLAPRKTLAGYKKVFIEGETSASVTIRLDRRAFEFWDSEKQAFRVCDGEYKIIAAASAWDIKKEISVKIDGDYTDRKDFPAAYKIPLRNNITDEDFAALYGKPFPEPRIAPTKGNFTLDCCLDDLKKSFVGKIAVRTVVRHAKTIGTPDSAEREAFLACALYTPLAAAATMSDGNMSPAMARGVVEMANGKLFKGLKLFLKKSMPET